jgi:hypothetical protein
MAETVAYPWPLGYLQGRGSVLYSAPGVPSREHIRLIAGVLLSETAS